jgi:hypothetical protein
MKKKRNEEGVNIINVRKLFVPAKISAKSGENIRRKLGVKNDART